MKLKEAINADTRKEGVWEGLHELLFKIPPLKKYEQSGSVPLEKLEKLMKLFSEKHGVQIQYIMCFPQESKDDKVVFSYSCSIKERHTHEWLGTVYGLTIYECFVKMVLFSYGYIKKK